MRFKTFKIEEIAKLKITNGQSFLKIERS